MSRLGRAVAAALAFLLLAAGTSVAGILHAPVEDDVITVLLLGADQGPPRGGSPLDARADAFHLLTVSADRQHATILNFPRDSYVPVPGLGRTKINACLTGGPERCVATVEQNFGVQVDAWFVTSMLAMANAFAEFGGVEVEVERPLSDGGPDIDRAGRQLLKKEALTFARDRKSRPSGDFRRSEAQGELLLAAHEKLLAGGASIPEVMGALSILQRHTVTSASAADLVRYAFAATELPPANVANVNVPGNVGFAGQASVVFLPDRAYAVVRDAADGRVG